ncbi:hypothetical protein [Polaribacter cellanae]|uniref:Uncharacterized protein n=1 Tax=Polaribacter cellanae TaxID=2818493 RepID=A0A975H7R9_9FLAO|nr:hypothetical protein [Polaribacter cellanae]QTE23353.1 hypothetical protein J3359_03480 [Polaribacter cellanae]
MKKIITLIILIILIVILIKMKNIYKVNREYAIFNEFGKEIPSKIIKKKNDNYVVIFSIDKLLPYSALVISPKNKLIGIPNGGSERYFNLTKNYIYDKWTNDNSFTIIYIDGKEPFKFNQYNEYPNKEPIVKNINFLDTKVSFDSFDKLKEYGKKVVLKKIQ